MSDDTKKVIAGFKEAVNMTAQQLQAWLETDESRAVGYKGDKGGESVGHHAGRRIIDILGKKRPNTARMISVTWPRSSATFIATWPSSPRGASRKPLGVIRS